MKHKIAVKAFILNKNNELLIVKRAHNDPYLPGIWELPGGKLEEGENHENGLIREVKEETDLDIELLFPLGVRHFQKNENLLMTLITYICTSKNSDIKLSNEHSEHDWENIEKDDIKLGDYFHHDLERYKEFFLNKK